MTMLHTVNKSPFERNTLTSCLRLAKKGSSILLIEDGVIGAMQNTRYSTAVSEAMKDFKFYALEADLKARGIDNGKVIDGITLIDYSGFVDLTVEHNAVQSWL